MKWNEVWKFWKETLKSVLKLEVNENKQTEYTKEVIKKIPIGKCAEVEDKCNSMIRIVGEDQAW